MASYNHEMPDPSEDEQLLETFKQMNQYLPHLLPSKEENETQPKKAKRAPSQPHRQQAGTGNWSPCWLS